MQTPSIERTPEGWDATTEGYNRVWFPFFGNYAEDALRLAGVKAGDRVLDVAAGPGTLALRAARRGATVVATDFAPLMIERLRRHATAEGLTNVTAQVMDGQALALPDGSCDAAFSMFGLMFFPDRAAGFRELYRVLRPGGVAAVGAWSRPERVRFAMFFMQMVKRMLAEPTAPSPPPAINTLQHPETFAAEMRAAGFARVEVHTVVHTWEAPTPEAAWEAFQGSSAVFPTLSEAEHAVVRPAFLDALRAEFGDGPVRLDGEAHIGVGVK